VPPGKHVHAIVDNYATHKHPKVRAWQAARYDEKICEIAVVFSDGTECRIANGGDK
jgi:hypothetical protein